MTHSTSVSVSSLSVSDLSQKKVFTTGEAAEICKVSQQTIIRCFDSGRLLGFKVPGSKFRRIPREDLIRFMRGNDIPIPSALSSKLIATFDVPRGAIEQAAAQLEGEFTLLPELDDLFDLGVVTTGQAHLTVCIGCASDERLRVHVIEKLLKREIRVIAFIDEDSSILDHLTGTDSPLRILHRQKNTVRQLHQALQDLSTMGK